MSDKPKFTEDKIQTLEYTDAIRKRPGMYIGSIDSRGFMTIINGIFCEIFENDEMMNDISFEIFTEKKGKIILKSQNEEIINKWEIKKENYLNPNKWNSHYMDLTTLNALIFFYAYSFAKDSNLIAKFIPFITVS